MNKVLGEFERTGTDVTRVALAEFKGHEYLEIRVYYEDKNSGERRPGKGITLNLFGFQKVLETLNNNKVEIEKYLEAAMEKKKHGN